MPPPLQGGSNNQRSYSGPTTGSAFDSRTIPDSQGGGNLGVMSMQFSQDQQQAGWDQQVTVPNIAAGIATGALPGWNANGIEALPGPLLNANTFWLLGYAEGSITFGDPLSGNEAFTIGSVPWYYAPDDVGGWLWASGWTSGYDPDLGYGEITEVTAQGWDSNGNPLGPIFNETEGTWSFPDGTYVFQFAETTPDVFVGISQTENRYTGAYTTDIVISPSNDVTGFGHDSGGPTN